MHYHFSDYPYSLSERIYYINRVLKRVLVWCGEQGWIQ